MSIARLVSPRLKRVRANRPVQNAYIQGANGKFRDECLNQDWFVSLDKASRIIQARRVDSNLVRQHCSPGIEHRQSSPQKSAGKRAAEKTLRGELQTTFPQQWDNGPISSAAEQIQDQAPRATSFLDRELGAGHSYI
jgi:hypothetical protein